jgi:hypothetical protein
MENKAAVHRRLLTKVTAANWAELKTKCEAGTNTCSDDPSFRDAYGYTCIAWLGYNCNEYDGYDAQQMVDIRAACPATCGTCPPPGGNEVTLTDSFNASSYAGKIDFSGKTCVVIGHGQTLDAGKSGRIFYGFGPGSSLEVHGLVLMNGFAALVSNFSAVFRETSLNFPQCPGAPRGTIFLELLQWFQKWPSMQE